jgi:hypothetical protein
MYNLTTKGNYMKRTFFALALLVPALASAAVKLDMNVKHNDKTVEESFEFAEVGESKVVTPTGCGAEVTMKLLSETEETATFKVKVVQDDETKCKSEVPLNYGEEHTFECTKACVDASVKMTASHVS